MRKKIVVGNWKMNTTPIEGLELVRAIAAGRKTVPNDVTLVVAPPYTHLAETVKATRGRGIAVAAQNCADHARGAYTGEVSAAMIASLGVEYVIVGHSERRGYYGEGGAMLAEKLALAFDNNLVPIYCVGEKLADRQADEQFDVVGRQLAEAVFGLTPERFARLIVAYEPVWAIGTGKNASAAQAQEMHAHIRGILAERFGDLAAQTPILYGGSCNPGNAAELFAGEDVDGGLIGGASLVAEDFLAIGKSF